jgi:cytochrome c oxidase subunit III
LEILIVAAHVEPHAAHHPALQHHFDNMEQQREAGSIGMWAFLVQEVMFFGGMFMAYLYFRSTYPFAFAAGSNHLNVKLGAINTVVLICSSVTMALAVYYAQTGVKLLQVFFLVFTMMLGSTFLVVKYFEYKEKYEHHLIPVNLKDVYQFHWAPEGEDKVHDDVLRLAASPAEQAHWGHRVQSFFWIYFAMTGMHALHMIIGLGLLTWLLIDSLRSKFGPQYHAPVELVGLYWHFVDIVWIFLFPLLYLLGRHYLAGH